jgi:hypothetical protein
MELVKAVWNDDTAEVQKLVASGADVEEEVHRTDYIRL